MAEDSDLTTTEMAESLSEEIMSITDRREDRIKREVSRDSTRKIWTAISVLAVVLAGLGIGYGYEIYSRIQSEAASTAKSVAEKQLEDQRQKEVEELQKSIAEINLQRESEGKPPIESIDPSTATQDEINLKLVAQLAAVFVPPGKDGKDGEQGIPGLPGIDGQDGLDGKDGVDGQNGQDGVSIVAVASSGCDLVVSLSDGTSATLSFTCLQGTSGRGVTSENGYCSGVEYYIARTYTDGTADTDLIEGATICQPQTINNGGSTETVVSPTTVTETKTETQPAPTPQTVVVTVTPQPTPISTQ